VGLQLREPPLGEIGIVAYQEFADQESKDGVAQKLLLLVIEKPRFPRGDSLVGVRSVGQGAAQQPLVSKTMTGDGLGGLPLRAHNDVRRRRRYLAAAALFLA